MLVLFFCEKKSRNDKVLFRNRSNRGRKERENESVEQNDVCARVSIMRVFYVTKIMCTREVLSSLRLYV